MADIKKVRRSLLEEMQEDLLVIQSAIKEENLSHYATMQFASSVLSQVLHISGIAYPPKAERSYSTSAVEQR